MGMQVMAATAASAGADWAVRELELDDDLGPHDVLVRVEAAGLCHSDEHLRLGTLPSSFPFVGGHEGAGVVERVGSSVTLVAEGDRVVFAFRPVCGRCRFCQRGASNLCVETAAIQDPLRRKWFRDEAGDYASTSMIGSFSTYTVAPEISCIRLPDAVPSAVGALLGCAVPTGFSAVERAGGLRAAESLLVVGAGGVGINAVQAGRVLGAEEVIVVDASAEKAEDARRFGATASFTSCAQVAEHIAAHRGGRGVDVAVITVGVPGIAESGIPLLDRGGRLVLAALGAPDRLRLDYPIAGLVKDDIVVRGTIAGSSNLRHDVPRYAALYAAGRLLLDELVSETYPLEQIGRGYADMHAGRSIRGLVTFP